MRQTSVLCNNVFYLLKKMYTLFRCIAFAELLVVFIIEIMFFAAFLANVIFIVCTNKNVYLIFEVVE